MIGSASSSRATGTCRRTADASNELVVLELGAEEVDRVGDLERAARAGAFVEHRRREARQAELARRIVAAAALDDEVDLHDRHLVRLDEPDRQPVRQLALLDRRQLRRGGGPERRRLRAIGRLLRGEQRRRDEQSAASTMTRSHRRLLRLDDQLDAPVARQPLARGGLDVGRRQRAVAREVLVEVVGIAAGRGVGVQLIGLAAESADALHPAVERRLDLVQRALDFARRRAARAASSRSPRR